MVPLATTNKAVSLVRGACNDAGESTQMIIIIVFFTLKILSLFYLRLYDLRKGYVMKDAIRFVYGKHFFSDSKYI